MTWFCMVYHSLDMDTDIDRLLLLYIAIGETNERINDYKFLYSPFIAS